jgi:hypothetical protein
MRIRKVRNQMLAKLDLATTTPEELQHLLAIIATKAAHGRGAGAPPRNWRRTTKWRFLQNEPNFPWKDRSAI